MTMISRQYSGDGVDRIVMNSASYGEGSAAEGGLSFCTGPRNHGQGEAPTGAALKFSLSAPLLQECADESSGDGDGEVADHGSPLCIHPKKRRLSAEQVRSLEMSFEVEAKLEPERKLQLAKEVGLQPRQVAIWFQNRRARWKTKQLERDYDILKAAYDSLLSEKEKLQDEIALLHVQLGSSSEETTEAIKRKLDHSDCVFNQSKIRAFEDLRCKVGASPLHLSDNNSLMLKQPYSESHDQQLHSPASSDDASFDSTGGSLLTHASKQTIHDSKVCNSSPVDHVSIGSDQIAANVLQSAKFGAGDRAHYVQLVKEQLLGTVRNPQSYQQIAFKQELADKFQEEAAYNTFFTQLDENHSWPWCWD